MIVHLFPQEKFTEPFIKFINNNFRNEEHLFLIHGFNSSFKKDQLLEYANILYLSKLEKESLTILCKYIKEAEQVIIHSLFCPKWMLIYFLFNKKVLKKCNWIIWGADLYCFREKNNKRLSRKIKLALIKRMAYITTLVDSDYDLAKEWCNVSGIHKRAIYINPITLEYLDNIKKNNIREDNTVNIQIGNSADISNQHIEVIDILSKYKDNDIKVYVPLSYGDREYAVKVKKYGEKMLGERFIAILDFMDPNLYSKFLGSIDIAIFNNNRQQALGNIFALTNLGAKLYMRSDTTMWNELVEREGYNFNSIKNLKEETFEELKYYNYLKKEININLSGNRFDEKYIAKVWKNIFEK